MKKDNKKRPERAKECSQGLSTKSDSSLARCPWYKSINESAPKGRWKISFISIPVFFRRPFRARTSIVFDPGASRQRAIALCAQPLATFFRPFRAFFIIFFHFSFPQVEKVPVMMLKTHFFCSLCLCGFFLLFCDKYR